jgi:hypothetical protein
MGFRPFGTKIVRAIIPARHLFVRLLHLPFGHPTIILLPVLPMLIVLNEPRAKADEDRKCLCVYFAEGPYGIHTS